MSDPVRKARISTSLSKPSGNLLYLSVFLTGFSSTIAALIDSGASLNFIHEYIVSLLEIPTEPCPPIRVALADGRVLLHSNRKVTLNVTIAGVPQRHTFYVAPIGIHTMILGMPWLEHINPLIDWRLKRVEGFRTMAERIRRGVRTRRAHKPAMRRSETCRLGDRCRERLRIKSCCLTRMDSATTERMPPGPKSRARVARA